MDPFDILNQEIPMTRTTVVKPSPNDDKLNTVMRFIAANPASTARQLVDRFDLDWSLECDLGNGLAKIGFYTDVSQTQKVMDLHDLTSNWFRG